MAACGDSGSSGTGDAPATVAALACELTFGLKGDEAVSALTARVDCQLKTGRIVGEDRDTDCEPLVASVSIGYINRLCGPDEHCSEGPGPKLYISVNGGRREIVGPRDILRCRYEANRRPTVDDFTVILKDASDGMLDDVDADFGITDITCKTPDGISTTTTSSTSTTLDCHEVVCGDGERCVGGACVADNLYELEFSLLDDVTLGAILILADYDCAIGDVLGDNDATECEADPKLPVASSFNDEKPDAEQCGGGSDGRLHAGFITLNGVDGPATLFRCRFRAADGYVPVPEDFVISILDVSYPDLRPVVPPPEIGVTLVESPPLP